MTKLYVLAVSNKGQPFDLKGDTIPIGRSSNNHILLKDICISSKHLRIIGETEKYLIKNLQESLRLMVI